MAKRSGAYVGEIEGLNLVALAVEPAEEDRNGARVVAQSVAGTRDDAQLGSTVRLSDLASL